MSKIQIIIDTTNPIKNRVEKKHGGKFNNLIANAAKNPLLLTPSEFASHIEKGYTFCVSLFEGERLNNNFISTQMICLDIDNNKSPDTAHMAKIDYYDLIERLAQFNIFPTFAYKTPSCGINKNPHNPDLPVISNYRIVILLTNPITDPNIAKLILKAFEIILAPLGEFDPACKDNNRFFYGAIANSDCLLPLYDSMLIKTDNDGFTDTQELEDLCDSFLCKIGDKNPNRNTITYYKNTLKKASKNVEDGIYGYNIHAIEPTFHKKQPITKNTTLTTQCSNNVKEGAQKGDKTKQKRRLRNINIELAVEAFVCLQDLKTGDFKHGYHNLKIIACSLSHIENGIDWMRNCMEASNKAGKTNYNSEDGDWGVLYNIDNRYGHYLPADLINLTCPKEDPTRYDKDKRYKNILSFFSESIGTRLPCDLTQPLPKYKLEDTTNFIQEKIDECMANGVKKVLFILPTGFGKTTFFKTIKEGTIAFKTNRLKQEYINDRFGDSLPNGVVQTINLDVKSFDNQEIATKIKAIYEAGLYSDVRELCNSLMGDENCSFNDSSLVASWLSTLEIFASENTRNYLKLTTHAYVLHGSNPTNILYIDEDPTFEQYKTRVLDFDNWFINSAQHPLNNEISKAGAFLLSMGHDEYASTPDYFNDLNCEEVKKLIRKKYQANLFPIFDSDFIHCRIEEVEELGKTRIKRYFTYISKVDLPEAEFTVIASATANEDFARLIWGEDIVIYNLSNMDLVGDVLQIGFSGSKSAIKTQLEHLDLIPTNEKELTMKENAMKMFRIVGDPRLVTITSMEMAVILKDKGMENICLDVYFGNDAGTNLLSGENGCVLGAMIPPEHIMGLYFKAFYLKDIHKDFFNLKKGWYSKYGERVKTFVRENSDLQELYMWVKSISLIQSMGRYRLLRLDALAVVLSDVILPFGVKYVTSIDKFDMDKFTYLLETKIQNKLNAVQDTDEPCIDCIDHGIEYHKIDIIDYNDGLGDNPF